MTISSFAIVMDIFSTNRHKNPNSDITNQHWLCTRWSTKLEREFGF